MPRGQLLLVGNHSLSHGQQSAILGHSDTSAKGISSLGHGDTRVHDKGSIVFVFLKTFLNYFFSDYFNILYLNKFLKIQK